MFQLSKNRSASIIVHDMHCDFTIKYLQSDVKGLNVLQQQQQQLVICLGHQPTQSIEIYTCSINQHVYTKALII